MRIKFSFADDVVTLMDVMPPQNSPTSRVAIDIVDEIRNKIHEYRKLWWGYQHSNPATGPAGPCCLNNTILHGKSVSNAIYDSANSKSTIAFTDGTVYHWPP